MTESDWLTCITRPVDMLQQLRKETPARKLLLLSCAICRLVWEHLPAVGTQAVIALERHLSDPQGEPDFVKARDALWAGMDETMADNDADSPEYASYSAVLSLMIPNANIAFAGCREWVQAIVTRTSPPGEKQAALKRVRHQICDLFREVVGNPFRPWKVVPDFLGGGLVQPDGRTVQLTDTARQLALGIHADQAYDRLPILADALEESGITDAELLTHCRQESRHVRGCWALDVALGKV